MNAAKAAGLNISMLTLPKTMISDESPEAEEFIEECYEFIEWCK